MEQTNVLDAFASRTKFEANGQSYDFYRLKKLEEEGLTDISRLPYSIRVLLESVLRQQDGRAITKEHVENLAKWGTADVSKDIDVPFKPARVVLQDFTGVPTVVDLASLRKAMADLGGDPNKINPEIPVDLVVDHSVQVDAYGFAGALMKNMDIEFERNEERYKFLRWAQTAFDNYRAVPPATGIVHQVNLEYLASVVLEKNDAEGTVAYPDSLVGTDSHTTMINGLGVLGWGVGGIEAEASMLGQPSYFPVPDVVGVKIIGEVNPGVTATDVALVVTEMLRHEKVVGKFVEFFGPSLHTMPLSDRATIANMAPEYGATCGFFPVDTETLNYMRTTGRSEELISLVEEYSKANDLFYTPDQADPTFTKVLTLDLSKVQPSLAGPKRPQDRINLSDVQTSFIDSLSAPAGNSGFGLDRSELDKTATVKYEDGAVDMSTGDVAIAAITSCTNTSNPYVMVGAGLVAKKAVERGLTVPKYVKTSLAPGSKVVTDYLDKAGLTSYLDELGFNTVGYGCTTCIGNSGPLDREVEDTITENDLLVSSVLSGNRNFEGRVHPLVKANFLASPPLVVAYALAGSVNFDIMNDSFGTDKDGNEVYFKDIWPSNDEIKMVVQDVVSPEAFRKEYETVFTGNERWNALDVPEGNLYDFSDESTYIQNPPFFEQLEPEAGEVHALNGLRVIGKFADSVTTDHISPAGSFSKTTPAGQYLLSKGVEPIDFNSYGSRRGNHEVMMRGTFANIRIRNQVAPGTEGGFTTYWPTGEIMPMYDAAMKYKEQGTGLVVLAGNDYGMGSSRDWAAKGTNLLGIRAVIAQSFERIHRSNLVMMGVLPLQFLDGESAESLGLTGEEAIDIQVDESVRPRDILNAKATHENGTVTEFKVIARFDSEVEIDYYRHGGILQMVLRNKLK
ncbi:aconitate hydratase AcnA [Exiguobacterium profundum]|uniref:Aconitate hydratase n=4 Tax=Bacilli TaxID=91061 RepID=C4L2R7_EXISA|nr:MULTISPECIES: aconitate hydratase AcnA [Exiguobacterium]QPI68959.1 aconitate hydratase AcnA [Exiguobacterium sp. PBE]ACQ69325.1 aconitate hydratase 1 [Exiguobacterium sp. AT1b]MCT4796853.1 aconitate hydratase AcnA [Exiguobacterium profundum]MDT0191705.1 aconitate hydratase AcnA [Exiguobacterium sp. BG5(2022)]WED56570.1 aconitate hydratase AcnA [Exiguobacterium profundum]